MVEVDNCWFNSRSQSSFDAITVTGNGTFGGKVTAASTTESDSGTTLVTKDYLETSTDVPGNGALTVRTYGHNADSTGTFTANQSGAGTVTLPQIRYTDISGTPTIPTNNNELSNGAGYTTFGNPAILSNGSTPSLNSGISGAEIRSLDWFWYV